MDGKWLKRPPQLFDMHTALSACSANVSCLSNQNDCTSYLSGSRSAFASYFRSVFAVYCLGRESGDIPSDIQRGKPCNIPQNTKVLTWSSRKGIKEYLCHSLGKAEPQLTLLAQNLSRTSTKRTTWSGKCQEMPKRWLMLGLGKGGQKPYVSCQSGGSVFQHPLNLP